MDQGNFRSLRAWLNPSRSAFTAVTSRGALASLRATPAALLRAVGRALGASDARSAALCDGLEQRSMLEGSFATAIVVALDGNGLGSSAGAIDPAVPTTNNDFYRFVAPANDFVTILADTANETSTILDTRITVFAADQTTIVAQGTNNGRLTRGIAKDGWAGFIAQANATYYVVVASEGTNAGPYTLRVDAASTAFDIGGELPNEIGVGRELGSPIPDLPDVPITPILGELTLRQEDIVYRYTVPSDQRYDSIVTVNAQYTNIQNLARRLDTRIDIYDAQGVALTNGSDSDSGRINDSFAAIKVNPGEVYFIRVRSDEIANANVDLATGPFFLVLDGMATDLVLNPVTRVFTGSGAFNGFGDPTTPASRAVPNPGFQTDSYEFTALGSGTTIITVQPTGLAPVSDPAIRLYDASGTLIAFNDNFRGASSQLEVQLTGAQRYFLVIDGFEVNSQVQYTLDIESNHTFDPTADTTNDDHANNPIFADQAPVITDAIRAQFNRATTLNWNQPRLLTDANRNPLRDRGYVVDATGTGRIYNDGDTDLFKFVPQVDMLNDHAGDNNDAGNALYVGGAFNVADPNTPYPVGSRNLATWDAADWFFTGAQFFDPAFNVTYGFNDNPGTATAGPVIYTLFDFDQDPNSDPQGISDHILMIGGDFTVILPGQNGPIFVNNVIGWGQNPNTGRWGYVNLVGSTNGAVRSFATFDPESFDPDGDGPAGATVDNQGLVLAMGGDFTDVLGGSNQGVYVPGFAANFFAAFDFEQGVALTVPGLTGPVRTMATYDFADPGAGRTAQVGPPPLTAVADAYDPPLSLVLGGSFAGGITTWDGRNQLTPLSLFGSPTNAPQPGTVNGRVNALTVISDPDPDGAGPKEAAEVLVIAGLFSNGGNENGVGNIVKYGRPAVTLVDPTVQNYNPRLLWEKMTTASTGTAGGIVTEQSAPGEIHALQIWDTPDINNTLFDPLLMIGGNFTTVNGQPAGNIGAYGALDPAIPAANLSGALGVGANGVVRTLAVAVDDQEEPSIASNLRTGNLQDVLYLGGDFTEVQFDPAADPVRALGVAQFSAFRGLAADFFDFSALNGGVAADVDATNAQPGDVRVFALLSFDDGTSAEWDRHDRRATRLSITLSPTSGGFLNTWVRVYDSNLTLVYDFQRPGSDTISPPFPDPAGMIDFSRGVSQDFTLEGIQVWGGETYYIEVSGGPNNTGQGRYNITISADALPLDVPIAPATEGDGVPDDMDAFFISEPIEGRFAAALRIGTTLGNGDGANVAGSSTQPFKGNSIRVNRRITPSLNLRYQFASDLGNISTLTDTDLYYFRAEFTGTAEIRVATLGLQDEFGRQVGNDFAGQTRTYNSNLDSALRIFDNDFQQLAYNNDATGLTGTFQNGTVGTIAASFTRKDPRIVINVEAGKNYFIQVESGQRYLVAEPADAGARVANAAREIDFGRASGSYALLVNAMPRLAQDIDTDGQSVTDDHIDFGPDLATVLPIANDGTGSIAGVINNTPVKPTDQDLIRLQVPGNGSLRIALTNIATTLNATMRVFFIDPAQGPQDVGEGQPNANGDLVFTTAARASEEYLILITGLDNSEGSYTLAVSGVPFVDDHADFLKAWNATDVKLFDFLGSGETTGSIEVAGDSDMFRFSAIDFQRVRATVTALDPSLVPTLEIYEVSEDPRGNPVFLRIGNAPNAANANNTTVLFPVAPQRVIDVAPVGPGAEDRVYPFYYAVVRGVDANNSVGRYRLAFQFAATDDHPDGSTIAPFTTFDTGEFNLATNIALDSTTGRGLTGGTIEVASDSDLFKFTAPTSGEASVLVSRPTTSILRPRVTIVDQNANIILDVSGFPAEAIGEDSTTFFQATVAFNVVRGTTYFIIVQGFEEVGVPNTVSSNVGEFTVSVNTPPIDDYPNVNEWSLSDVQAVVQLGSVTGLGQIGGDFGGAPGNPLISPSNDTDLFNFTTRLAGTHTVTVTPFNTTNGRLAPRITVFIQNTDGSRTEIAQSVATSALQEVTVTISGAAAGTKYYVLVNARVPLAGATPNGEYRLRVQGPADSGGGGGSGDIDFASPTQLTVATRTGDACFNDSIEAIGDRDLFRFRTAANGTVFIQVTTPDGSLLDAAVSVYNQANELVTSRVAFDADGTAGVTANVSFIGTANTDYYIIVDGLGDSVGTYQLCVDSRPTVNYLYFPEGFASDSTREFISIDNPNSATASYTVYLRYEGNFAPTIIGGGTVAANSRGGLTLIDGTNFVSPGVRKDTPYSVVIESDLPLGATLAHYDFGSSIGDSFTERVSSTWNFARVERDNGAVLDFIVFYNPQNFDVEVTLTAYQTDQPAASITLQFGALRRGGFSINDIPNFPRGVFSVQMTARAANAANAGAFEGVVASLSHYEIGADAAWGLIGDPDNGARAGAITSFFKGTFSRSEAIFFNPNDAPATVTLTGSYLRSTLPQFSRTFDIRARGQVILTDADFGLIEGQPVGLAYTSSQPITVNGANYQQGDADSSTATVDAGTRFLFGDAFIDPALAGNKFFEYLYFYNPTASNNTISVKLNFTDGTSSIFTTNVNSRGFAEVRLHERAELLNRSGPSWFAVEATSSVPFAMSMTHYDLLLGGGWATLGVPSGFANPISRIP
jgi:hypothetical protein